MRKVIHKAIFVWNFDREEQWLNEMAAKGLCLVSVGFCKYEFEDCLPGEYRICMQLLDQLPSHPESQAYLSFLESTGVEQVGAYFRWVYLRRKSADGEFNLFSDQKSRCQYLSRVIRFVGTISVMNLVIGLCNTVLAAILLEPIYYWAWINVLLGLWGCYGTARLLRKRNKMKREAQLFE